MRKNMKYTGVMVGRSAAGLYDSKMVYVFRGHIINPLGLFDTQGRLKKQFPNAKPGEVVKVYRVHKCGKVTQSFTYEVC